MKTFFRILFFSLLMWGCRAHLTYVNDYPMSTTAFVTRDGLMRGMIPQGWFISHEDTLVPTLDAWLVKNDFSATISLTVLAVDPLTSQTVQKEGLGFLAKLSMKFHEIAGSKAVTFSQPNVFELQGKKFCEYEIFGPDFHQRVVVFPAGQKYFECEARAAKNGWSEEEIHQLFRTQQSVIASLSH